MLRYVKYQNKSELTNASGLWYLRIKNGEQINLEELAAHMAEHNTPYSKGTIVGILTDMVACIKEQLLDGKTVKLSDLAIFSLGCHCKGESNPADLTAANITTYTFNARGTGELSTRNVSLKVRIKEQDYYDTPATEQEEEEVA